MMTENKISQEDLQLLNSKYGIRALLRKKKVDVDRAIRETKMEYERVRLQTELVKLQTWVIENNKKVVILFEGRDAAGKSGAIRRITEHINPRHFSVIALDIPTSDERKQWFFQRYINHLPKPGEIVFFDRSWYNRAVVEPVNGFCSSKEYEIFMDQVNEFERMLIQSETYLIKFYFSISKEEQERRFSEILSNPLKRWKMTKVDEDAQKLWDDYTSYKERMFEHTHTELAPWTILEANEKGPARLKAMEVVLSKLPYKE